MALIQKINAQKLISKIIYLFRDGGCRMSLLDVAVLLEVNSHGSIGKMDLNESILGNRENKSSMDRPARRLLSHGFIQIVENKGGASNQGEAKRFYEMTEAGQEFLRSCY